MYNEESKSLTPNALWRAWSSLFDNRMTRAQKVASNVANQSGKIKVSEPGGLSVFSDIDLFGFEKKNEGPGNDRR